MSHAIFGATPLIAIPRPWLLGAECRGHTAAVTKARLSFPGSELLRLEHDQAGFGTVNVLDSVRGDRRLHERGAGGAIGFRRWGAVRLVSHAAVRQEVARGVRCEWAWSFWPGFHFTSMTRYLSFSAIAL